MQQVRGKKFRLHHFLTDQELAKELGGMNTIGADGPGQEVYFRGENGSREMIGRRLRDKDSMVFGVVASFQDVIERAFDIAAPVGDTVLEF